MKKTIWNIVIMIVCLIAIVCWLYFRVYNGGREEVKKEETPESEEIAAEEVKEEGTPEAEEIAAEEVKEEGTPEAEEVSAEEVKEEGTPVDKKDEEKIEEEKISEEMRILFNKPHIKYILQKNEKWVDGTIKLKQIMETTGTGYNYDRFKKTRVFFYIKNGSQKLKWDEAYKIYYKKKTPERGDFFYMERFSY